MSTFLDRRIVVARSAQRAAPLAERLRAAGARVSSVELTTTRAPSDGGEGLRTAAARIDDFDWLLFSSARGAEALDVYPDLKRARHIAAVGPTTAAALEQRGCRADLVASGTGGAELADLILEQTSDSGPLLFIGAQSPAGGLVERLTAAGREVVHVASYQTVPRDLCDDEREILNEAEIIVVAAPSGVAALHRELTRRDVVVVATGPTTSRAARDAEFRVVEAATPAIDDLVEALGRGVEMIGSTS